MRRSWCFLGCLLLAACGGSLGAPADGTADAAEEPGDDSAADEVPAIDAAPEVDAASDADEVVREAEAEAGADAPADAPGEEVEPTACPVTDDLGHGDHTQVTTFDLLPRGYIVHVPDSYAPATPAALVLNLHGFMSANWQQVLFSDMNTTSDREGFVVVYPDGVASSWNAGSCCGTAASTGVDDVGFLRAVVAEVSARLCIDRRRVYATGMSNGGYMAHRLGCEASDVFAAVAPVSGALGVPGCTSSRPMPVIAFHGLQDPLVWYEDGRAAIDRWVRHDGCTGDPVRTDFGGSYCLEWSDCVDGVRVKMCTLDPEGHCWPGGSDVLCVPGIGPFNDDIDANDAMWEFFERFALP
ncbi:MAG: prolyl oligopeptidase family serine peptidase [Deltaproteobacteria bacterium]|nr:prolyl oligopeptidase family serine peptidase [Deltaproteobacteria bacterium]